MRFNIVPVLKHSIKNYVFYVHYVVGLNKKSPDFTQGTFLLFNRESCFLSGSN